MQTVSTVHLRHPQKGGVIYSQVPVQRQQICYLQQSPKIVQKKFVPGPCFICGECNFKGDVQQAVQNVRDRLEHMRSSQFVADATTYTSVSNKLPNYDSSLVKSQQISQMHDSVQSNQFSKQDQVYSKYVQIQNEDQKDIDLQVEEIIRKYTQGNLETQDQ